MLDFKIEAQNFLKLQCGRARQEEQGLTAG